MKSNVFNNNQLYVCARMCDTCIFRPGNLMNLNEGRVEQMVADAMPDGHIPCHHTLDHRQKLVCRGFWAYARREGHSLFQLAERLGLLVEEDPHALDG